MVSAIVTWSLVAGFVVGTAVVLAVQARRIRMQRVVFDGGVLSTSDPITGKLNGLAVGSIGTVVYLPEQLSYHGQGTNGIWTWGGIVVLDTTGRLARHIVHIPGSDLALSSIYEAIPAPRHVRIEPNGTPPYSRSEFVRQFPRSLGVLQLRGATWMSIAIVTVLFLGLAIAVAMGIFIAAALMMRGS